jgi:hypothetical protein
MNPSADISKYIHQFSHLRMDKTGGRSALTTFRSSHKPFLLFAILDLFAQARITSNLIRGTAAGAAALQPSRSEPWDPTDPAPYCPACGEQMLLRTAQRGANTGNKFYVCPNYPRCREIIPLETG